MDGQENTNEATEPTITPAEITADKKNVGGVEVAGEQSVSGEAQAILADPVIVSQLNPEVLKEKGMLQKISDATHHHIKSLALAFAMLLAAQAKEAVADNIPKEPVPTLAAKAEAKGLSSYENKDEDQMFLEKATNAVDFARQNMGKIESMESDIEMKGTYGSDWIKQIKSAVNLFSHEKDNVNLSIAIKSSNELKRAVDTAIKVAILEKDTIESLDSTVPSAQPGVISASADFDNVK